ncbi:MAG TPA: BON domain-containing protein [Thermoleophilaceae bacterium]
MFKKLLFGAAAAGAIAWLSKNQETAKRYVERYAGQAKGMAGAAPGVGSPPAEDRLNDPALAQKVESEVFRDDEIPKDKINVNVEYGVVYLRGEVPDRELMDELVARTRKVEGVQGVENLTHLAGSQAS